MENIYLKKPTINDMEQWIDYCEEERSVNPKRTPLGFRSDSNYLEWLDRIEDEANGRNLLPGRVPSSVYFLMNNNLIIGCFSIRHNIDTEFLSLYGGHIGYSIRPSERRRGYATKMLRLGLEKCLDLGLKEVMISCLEDNIPSSKVIEANGGVLREVIYNPDYKCNLKKYTIDIEKVLDSELHNKK